VCDVTPEVNAVPASRCETFSSGRSAVPMRVRSVAYAVRAVASSGSAGGVRIHSSSSGGPAPGESRLVTDRVSQGIRSSPTAYFSPGTDVTGAMAWWLGPSSDACRDTAAVAITPAGLPGQASVAARVNCASSCPPNSRW
jgi:hypothetical protein